MKNLILGSLAAFLLALLPLQIGSASFLFEFEEKKFSCEVELHETFNTFLKYEEDKNLAGVINTLAEKMELSPSVTIGDVQAAIEGCKNHSAAFKKYVVRHYNAIDNPFKFDNGVFVGRKNSFVFK